MSAKKLAIIVTHPIQYYVPLFQILAKSCTLKVFYTWGKNGISAKYDPDFKKTIGWDIPLLDGYTFEILKNTSAKPGSHHFSGIVTPYAINRIELFAPDAILVYGWAYQSHLKILRYFKGKVPLWFRGDSTLLDAEKGIKKLLRNISLKWIYHHIDKAFYVGTNNKAYYKAFGLKDKQLVFAPHAVNNDFFSVDRKAEAKQLRNELGIEDDIVLVLFAGKFEEKKNPRLLLNAIKKLNEKNVHLLFVGDGFLEKELRSAATDQVSFLPFQNQTQMPVIYQAADLFCLPSKGPGETWGLAVNEAMATEKPILVSNKVGCAVDLAEDDVNGYVFQSDDLNDLTLKLAKLTRQKSLLTEMGNQSAKTISNWTIKKQAEVILKELNEHT